MRPERIKSIQNYDGPLWNRNRELLACGAVLHPNVPPSVRVAWANIVCWKG